MVKASELIDKSFGIKGYTLPDYNIFIDKPTVYKIAPHSEKKHDFLSVI